ncbi:MAG TPA: TetR/AcrR family transcriptional regulator [Streptosporangiaceae bacterium]|nr:TetR/AcrR family transcriptional regulator [Streptosporangiaceae bacterium]
MNDPQRVDTALAAAQGAAGERDSRTRSGTRARIQQVAVELFTEHGYEGTSLREIAERLDVTKAALYYHFKSKEDIVTSLVEDYSHKMDQLIAWGREQPRTAQARREIMSRYVDIVAEGDKVFRMLHQNQAAVSMLASAKSRGELFKERIQFLIDLLTEPGAGLPERVKAAMAIGGISVGWMFFADQSDRHELTEALSTIASEIAELPYPGRGPAGH